MFMHNLINARSKDARTSAHNRDILWSTNHKHWSTILWQMNPSTPWSSLQGRWPNLGKSTCATWPNDIPIGLWSGSQHVHAPKTNPEVTRNRWIWHTKDSKLDKLNTTTCHVNAKHVSSVGFELFFNPLNHFKPLPFQQTCPFDLYLQSQYRHEDFRPSASQLLDLPANKSANFPAPQDVHTRKHLEYRLNENYWKSVSIWCTIVRDSFFVA